MWDSTPNKQTNNPIKNEQWTDTLPKRIYRWPTDTWKDAQHHQSSEKCKLKAQWDITSHLSEWLSAINQQKTSVGEDVEKREPLCTVGGNVDWCSHCGKQCGVNLKKLKIEPFMTQWFHF